MIFQNQTQNFQNQICNSYIHYTPVVLWNRQKKLWRQETTQRNGLPAWVHLAGAIPKSQTSRKTKN